MAVENNSGTWVVATGCGVWIPARLRHSIAPTPAALARTLYISAIPRLKTGGNCRVLAIGPLLRAIVDHLHRHAVDKHLVAVLLDQLAAQRALPLFIPALTTPLAKRIAALATADHSDQLRIRDLSAELKTSDRTIERAFAADAGMPLGEWRQRTRIARAIALLAGGMDVKDVALEVGYETASAFVVSFKKYVGITPGTICPA